MSEPVKILILEDSATDAELIQRLLMKEKKNCQFRVAMNKDNFLKDLDEFSPDIILSDNSLPQFNSTEALKIVRQRLLQIPFILVTGTVSDEFAANIIKSGADDYVLKDRLTRLPAAIDTAIMKRQMEREKLEATEKLIQSEENYRTIFYKSPLPKWIYDPETLKFLEVNETAVRHYGYSQEEFLNMTIKDITPEKDTGLLMDELTEIESGSDSRQGNWRHLKKNNEVIIVETTAHSIDYNGKKARMVVVNDITEKIKAEELLAKERNLLRALIDNLPDHIYVKDKDSRYIITNRSFVKLAGVASNTETIGKKVTDLFDKETGRVNMDEDRRVLELGEEIIDREEPFLIYKGEKRWFLTTKVPLRDKKQNITGILGISKDITERKKAEEYLLQTQMRLKQAQAIAHLGNWELSFETNISKWSDEAYRIYGLLPGDRNLSVEDWMSFVHPDDLGYVKNLIERSQRTLSDIAFHHRIVRKDGVIRHVYSESKFEFNKENRPVGLYGIVLDVTESKEAEEKLSRNELRFRILTSNAPVGIFQTDAAGKTIYVNEAWMKITGLTFNEAMGDGWLGILHPDDREKETNQWMSRSKKGLESSSEFRLLDKRGNTRWVTGKATPLFNKSQHITGYIGTLTDITERKKADELLKESNRRYEFVNKATQDTIWEWDYHTRKGKWGEGIITTFGYAEDKLNYGENWIDEFVHPDDKERISKDIRNRIENSLQYSQNEYRFLCADGSYKYVFDRGYILYDENRKPYRMFGAMTDVTEKKRLERELAEQQIKQQKLITETIIQTQEKERNELGKELHDNINQILATAKIYLGMAKAKENISADLVSQSYDFVAEAMQEIRNLSHSLVAPSLDISLKEALEELAENANLFNDLKVQVLFDEKYYEKGIDKNKELMFYRIVQEQMNNIIKYAKASKVVITLKTDDDILVLSIADNGVGFNVMHRSKGIGLKNISSRVEFYSGNMNIISAPGQGCTLEIFIPC